MTLPDKVLSQWDDVEQEIRAELDKRVRIESAKAKQLLVKYKGVMERAIVAAKINQLGWDKTSIQAERVKTDCDMECVDYCFSNKEYRFENIKQVYQLCLKAQCDCTTGDVTYTLQEKGKNPFNLNDYGTDRDLYDKNGTKIYQYQKNQLMHRDFNLTNQQWKDTWHKENNPSSHSVKERSLENYREKLQNFSWISVPDNYELVRDCNMECSEECLQLRDQKGIPVEFALDLCNSKRCNCYYSAVQWDACNPQCMRSCLLVEGGADQVEDCVQNTCECGQQSLTAQFIESLVQKMDVKDSKHDKNEAHHNDIKIAIRDLMNQSKKQQIDLDIETVTSQDQYKEQEDVVDSDENDQPQVQTLFQDQLIEDIAPSDVPILQMIVTFSIFMGIIMVAYLMTVRYQYKKEKKAMKNYSNYNQLINKNDTYNEKMQFLESQEVFANTL